MRPEAPTVQLPVVGVRPVAGAIGACALMLLACSWLVFASDRGQPGVDVGAPAPVRIDDTARDVGVHARTISPPARARPSGIPRARVANPAARSAPATPIVRPTRTHDAAPPTAPATPAIAHAAQPAPAAQAAPAPVSTPPAVAAPPVTPPVVTVPSITVSLPSVPNVPLPAVTVTTPQPGLP